MFLFFLFLFPLLWIVYVDSRERLGNQRFEFKKDSNTQNKTQWYHYNLTLVSNCYQDWYQGINIFGEWYHYNLALVPSKCQPHAREIFQRIKWPKYFPFESPKRLKGLDAKTSSLILSSVKALTPKKLLEKAKVIGLNGQWFWHFSNLLQQLAISKFIFWLLASNQIVNINFTSAAKRKMEGINSLPSFVRISL